MSNTAQSLAGTRIASLLDENSFVEIGGQITARNTDFNMAATETPSDGVITGYGVIDGTLVYVYSQDVSVMNGTMPVAGGNIEVLSDEIIPDGNIVSGYGDLYLLAERQGSTFAQSSEYRFIEDQTVFKGTARYDGKPVIAEGFVAIGIGSAPQESATFPGDTANDASLADLSVDGAALSFNPAKYTYDASVTAATVTANAIATQNNAKVTMEYDGKAVNNASKLTTDAGGKNLVVTVKNGMSTLVYTVNIKKTGA